MIQTCTLSTAVLHNLTAIPTDYNMWLPLGMHVQGMAWIDPWGNLRYVASQAFMGLLHNKLYPDQTRRATIYTCFARKQARIMLGETGRSYVVSWGVQLHTSLITVCLGLTLCMVQLQPVAAWRCLSVDLPAVCSMASLQQACPCAFIWHSHTCTSQKVSTTHGMSMSQTGLFSGLFSPAGWCRHNPAMPPASPRGLMRPVAVPVRLHSAVQQGLQPQYLVRGLGRRPEQERHVRG
jgi:hypothetical protein